MAVLLGRKKRLFFLIIATLFLVALASCSPFYVMRAAYEEGIILLKREDISAVIDSSYVPDEEKRKLKLVLKAREFAINIGLNPKEAFTKYSRVEGDVVGWVLVAALPDAFKLYEWWFPFVGRVPYKGYFEKQDAERMASMLRDDGYETWVRGTEAFSTLGWFNDPVLSTTLRHDDVRIVNTVVHEIVHSTIWLPGHVDFNESLANFVGMQGAIDFYKHWMKSAAGCSCCGDVRDKLSLAEVAKTRELELGDTITGLSAELRELYESPKTREQKLSQRVLIFEKWISPLREKYQRMEILRSINNAEIIQLKLYLTNLGDFSALYEKHSGNWAGFLASIRCIKDQLDGDSDAAPYHLLRQVIKDEICR